MHHTREGGEVERELLDPAVPEFLDRADDQKLHQPVRRLPVAAHRRERHRRASVRGTKCRNPRIRPSPSRASGTSPPASRSVRSESIDIEKPRSHAPASQRLSDAFELAERALVELGQLGKLGRIAALLEPRDRLAHLPNRPAFEREAACLDDRFIADVEGAQPRLAPERNQAFTDTAGGELQPSPLGEVNGLGNESRQCRGRPDRVARDQHHAVLGPVGEEGAAGLVEQVLLVVAKLEEGECVRAVASDELPGDATGLGVRKAPRRGQRPEDEVGDGQQRTEGEQRGRPAADGRRRL